MRIPRTIFWIWLASLGIFGACLLAFPHRPLAGSTVAAIVVQMLLFLQCLRLADSEPTPKNKPIFLNFAILFATSLVFAVFPFVGPGGSLFTDDPYARVYVQQYLGLGLYYFGLSLAIVYLAIDALLRDFRIWQKYVIALSIVAGFYIFHNYSLYSDPKFLYHTSDIADWKAIDYAATKYQKEQGVMPQPAEIAPVVELYSWREGQKTGTLFPEEKLRRVTELYPYLEGDNYIILVYRPLYMNVIYLCVLSVGFILLFFGYQYMKDPPQGAYIERIMFLFLILLSLEILHAWSFVKSVEWGALAEVLGMGQYVSVGVLALIGVFFTLRLRFISSVKGEFYEQELAVSPAGVVRWRDSLDNMVIRHFLDPEWLPRRVLAMPRRFFNESGH